jgi:hypothetical protein
MPFMIGSGFTQPLAAAGGSTWALVQDVEAAALNTFSTGAIDTTGANLLVASVSRFGAGTLSDSKGNTWTALTSRVNGEVTLEFYYSVPSSVGSGHTFTLTGSSMAAALSVQAWSGAHGTPFDVQNGATASGTSVQPGSITPSQNNSLLISCFGGATGANTISINSGFFQTSDIDYAGGVNEAGSMAYLVQETAAPINPTWSNASAAVAASIAAFKPAS